MFGKSSTFNIRDRCRNYNRFKSGMGKRTCTNRFHGKWKFYGGQSRSVKPPAPIFSNSDFSANVTDDNFLQSVKAAPPIAVTEDGTITDSRGVLAKHPPNRSNRRRY